MSGSNFFNHHLKNNKGVLIGGTIGTAGSGIAVKYGINIPNLEVNIFCVMLICVPCVLFCAWIGSMFDNQKISQNFYSIENEDLDYSKDEEFINLMFQHHLKKSLDSIRK